LNDLRNVRLCHAALGAASGMGTLRVIDRSGVPLGGKSALVDSIDNASGERGERVPVVRIDDIVPADRQVAIIHLDVERREQQAIAGALATIRRCLPPLLVETVPDAAWIKAHLSPLGYAHAGRVGPNTLLAVGQP
jgi:FkbM family methyltransferase